MTRQAHTSTVVAPVHLVIGVVSAAPLGVLMVAGGTAIWLDVLIVLVVVVAVHLSLVRPGVGGKQIVVGLLGKEREAA